MRHPETLRARVHHRTQRSIEPPIFSATATAASLADLISAAFINSPQRNHVAGFQADARAAGMAAFAKSSPGVAD